MPGELIPVILFVSAAAVLIFRPLTTRIGRVIEGSRTERKGQDDAQLVRIMQLMERLIDRMDRLEDRLDFTERTLEQQRLQQLSDGHSSTQQERLRQERRPSRDDSF